MTRKAGIPDLEQLADLAIQIWKKQSAKEFIKEFSELIQKENTQFFLSYHQSYPIGFAQCQLRYDYVEGTESHPVGYLEGIFIKEEYRHKGYAKELLSECEKWALEQGCKEFASDCELDNLDSFEFHKHMGFIEANRIICFTKKLNSPSIPSSPF